MVRRFAAVLGLVLFAPAVAEALPPGPLDPAARAALAAIPADPAPPRLIQGQHYFVSNESFPERFREAVSDTGGIFVGVGPEQSYFFAGWAKPEILVLMDFDEAIVDLHRVYRAFFLAAGDPDAFVALWGDPAAGKKALEAAAGSAEELARLQEAYRWARPHVQARLKQARTRFGQLNTPTFLTDAAQYQSIVELAANGRMVALRGDLTGTQAMNGVAEAARKLALPVRVVYLSNVEQYFGYGTGLGANLEAQPIDERSMVLRTFWRGGEGDDGYRYIEQSAGDMKAWLKAGVSGIVKLLEIAHPVKKGKTWHVPGPEAAGS